MSQDGSISGITFAGLSSGIDTESIISKLAQLQSAPIQRYQAREQQIEAQQAVYTALRSKLQALDSAAGAFRQPHAFSSTTASSSSSDVATAVAGAGAMVGTYSLVVTQLAGAQKLASSAQSDTTSPLGLSGSFTVNGKIVQAVASDTLQTLAQKISSAGAGVGASVIDGGPGRAFLTLTGSASGAANTIQLVDSSGTVLADLGVLTGGSPAHELAPAQDAQYYSGRGGYGYDEEPF